MTVDAILERPVARHHAAPRVVAVLVLHEGESFLARSVAAIAGQRRPPDRVVAVDTGSLDDGPAVLAALWPDDAPPLTVLVTPRGTRFSAAVRAALDHAVSEPERLGDWLWLLHDDAAPDPDALHRLLAEVETAPSVAVAGCKQVSWDDGQRLVDVGFTASRLGAVVTGMDRGEVDQGQHDARSDVLAVGTAGMLVRRPVWTALGGPDAGLRGARDDLDLCRRARLAGHRVVVVPSAVVAHANAGAAGRRPGSGWYRDDRHDAIFLRLATVPLLLLPAAIAWTLGCALVRATARLVLKLPQQALDELVAPLLVLLRPDRWARARRRAGSTRVVPARALRPLRATPRQLFRMRRDEIAAWIVPAHRRAGMHAVGTTGAAARQGDRGDRGDLGARGVRPWRRGLAVLPVLALAAAASGIAQWRLLGSVPLAGPDLAPAPDSAARLWALSSSSWRPAGLGTAAAGDPFGQLLAAVSLPVADPRLLIMALLVAGPVLAAGTGWLAARAVVSSWAVRSWAALGWAAAPPLLAAQWAGHPGAVLAHVVLPLAGLALWRTVGAGSVTAAAAAGLALTVLVGAAPQLAPATLVLLAALAVVAATAPAGRPRRRALLLILTVAVPAALLLPWWAALARHPVLLLAGPPARDEFAPFRSPVAGFAGLTGFARLAVPFAVPFGEVVGAVSVPLVALALAALLRRRAAWAAALICWVAVLAGLGTALLADRVRIGDARPDAAPAWSLTVAGLLAAALVVAPAVGRRLRSLTFGAGHAAVAVLAVLCATGPIALLAGFTWSAARVPGPVHPVEPDVLPAIAAAQAAGPAAARTLVLDVGAGQVHWALARDLGPRLGAASVEQALIAAQRPPERSDAAVVVPVVGALLSDTGQDLRVRLADLAVGSVLLLPPVDENAVQALDASPGLVRVAAAGGSVLWRTDPGAARVRVLGPDAGVLAAVPSDGSAGLDVDTDLMPGPTGRTLVLAERSDPGWRAWLDGVALPAATHSGWAQAFALPAGGGRLVVRHPGTLTDRLDGARGAALVLAVLIALPLPRVRGRVAPPPAPRRSRPVVRDPRAVAGRRLRSQPKIFGADHPEHGDLPEVLP